MKWHKDPEGVRGIYWSGDGRYCVQWTASTAVGPWFVTYDRTGRDAGWGEMIVRYASTLADAKAQAEACAEVQERCDAWSYDRLCGMCGRPESIHSPDCMCDLPVEDGAGHTY